MGGTSTDVSLIDKDPIITTESRIGGYPIGIPMLDIHTIGAGGGSIASVDPGRALRVGPQSAGAMPGPACYGRGDPEQLKPTVTDANLFLGRLPADNFLGGEIKLDVERAVRAIKMIGDELEMDLVHVALGIIEVINTHMERALRVISVERGYDPVEYTLLSFGGAGGLHASNLARRLGISRILVPPLAATLSALGMAIADVVKDYSRTVMLPGDVEYSELQAVLRALEEEGKMDLIREGIPHAAQVLKAYLDIRYVGQSYELTVPFGKDFNLEFHRFHAKQYGYSRVDFPTEIVTIRIKAIGARPKIQMNSIDRPASANKPAPYDQRSVYLTDHQEIIPFFHGDSLQVGDRLSGPGVIVRSDTTVLVERGDLVEVDPFLNLIITVE
jgi:N-methylhydantoinase A